MKWLSQYSLLNKGIKQDLYKSNRTGHKVLLKKTKIQSGVIEVGTLQRLKGNSFPKLLDFCVNGEEMHIALQFIDGKTFNELKSEDMCPFTVNLVFLNALSTLDEIHMQGYIHCDIKPENMIFDSQFRVYIIDFGTAQPLDYQRVRDEWRGSALYMPPEALYTPESIDYRSDYYSLGKSLEHSLGDRIEFLSYSGIECLKSLCAIIPNDRPSNLEDILKTLKY
jgi:serine/threonine protein kinase